MKSPNMMGFSAKSLASIGFNRKKNEENLVTDK
jgi:hypothetical protein